ncbi:hypothetical protein EWM64_g4374 [Hericium alpestre]|uniref:Asl1-like glycosyl hydrolase catalytic domain-containing protein n=1 Tax=Hericium alpestre TaxID=135208 RepID=A0A4Y9ZYP0_9AGAM|nr:hypothetical protein EWM64_g4374 [Hericium alpestre]
MAAKFFNLIAISTLAILACSFNASPVNALSVERHAARAFPHAHEVIAKKKRSTSAAPALKPSSSPAPKPSSSPAAKPAQTSSSQPAASSPASKAAPANNNGGGGKAGLAWPNGDSNTLKQWKTAKTNFLYTWAPQIPDGARSAGFTPVPMLWGKNQVGDFQKLVKPGYATHAMGMNEPNQSGQSDMSPQDGAQLWIQYIEPLKSQGYTLISPATTSAPSGKTWMQDWLKACNGGCNPDRIAVHWYDVSADFFKSYVTDFHNTFNKDIWVTEFACQNFNGGAQADAGQVWSFMQEVTGWMDSTPWVEAYFAFGAMKDMQGVNTLDQLMDPSSGTPNALGKFYLGI